MGWILDIQTGSNSRVERQSKGKIAPGALANGKGIPVRDQTGFWGYASRKSGFLKGFGSWVNNGFVGQTKLKAVKPARIPNAG